MKKAAGAFEQSNLNPKLNQGIRVGGSGWGVGSGKGGWGVGSGKGEWGRGVGRRTGEWKKRERGEREEQNTENEKSEIEVKPNEKGAIQI
jgi:hypothetical protein